jgi:hypothetical protein
MVVFKNLETLIEEAFYNPFRVTSREVKSGLQPLRFPSLEPLLTPFGLR